MTNSQQQHAAAERIWQRFGEMFGARFFESYGAKPNASWAEALRELRSDQVRGALGKIRNSGAAFPPSLPEFIALAKNVRLPEPKSLEEQREYSPLHRFGQRALFRFLKVKGGASEASVQRLIKAKNEIVAKAEGSTADEIRDVLLAAFEPLWEPMPQESIDAACDRFTRTGRI